MKIEKPWPGGAVGYRDLGDGQPDTFGQLFSQAIQGAPSLAGISGPLFASFFPVFRKCGNMG